MVLLYLSFTPRAICRSHVYFLLVRLQDSIAKSPRGFDIETMSLSSSKMIILISSDGETFEVNEVVVLESQTIKNVIVDTCTDDDIPLPKVTSQVLAKVLEYCKKHVEPAIFDDDLKDWDTEFVEVDQPLYSVSS